ncbi:DUF6268 family outer membrane beta-barrel protein [Pseudozobellia thermophila]|uniref:DUF6268 domain-containing protein n=1 Tax=Pseudozobellia thermophila TaxID=192903 RepID=A0A1M6FP86_9FLAO|nr:DUF6268 family outer membrane beta-barrel protein [Pseudozobellia thermophila]SHI99531.1 hypothetical protein SAMN04488513_102504 [Pseudozobellia thermophila]
MKKALIFLSVLASGMAYAQETDGVYVDAQLLPGSDVGSVLKLEAGLTVPLINTAKEKLTLGGKVQQTAFDFVDKDVPFETDQIENFNSFGIKFTYQRNLSDTWALNLMGETQIASNFDENEIKTDDIFFNGLLTFDRYNDENNSMWTFGAAYDIRYGLYYPIPVLAYTKRMDEAWAYKLGVPDSRVKYSVGGNHEFEGFATLTGFTGNINDDIDIYKQEYTGTLRQTNVLLGLGYTLRFWDRFKATLEGGYTAYNQMQVRDYDNELIYDFEMPNSFYLNVGLKYTFDSKARVNRVY